MATTDRNQKLAFTEPGEDEPAGYHVYKRQKSPYERYMDEEGMPIFRGIGVRDTRELPLGDWRRRGGRGTFLYLNGCENVRACTWSRCPQAARCNPKSTSSTSSIWSSKAAAAPRCGSTARQDRRCSSGSRAACS